MSSGGNTNNRDTRYNDTGITGEGYSRVDRTETLRSQDSEVRVRIVSHPLSYVAGSANENKMDMFLQSQLNVRVKRVEADMNNGYLLSESGNFHMGYGQIKLDPLRFDSKAITHSIFSKKSGGKAETFHKQGISGTGKVLLNDTTQYLQMIKLKRHTKFVFEKGTFYAAVGDFDLGVTEDISVSGVAMSTRNMVIPHIEGTGIVIIESPVNTSELVRVPVSRNRPAIFDDGNASVIARVGNIRSKEEMSSGVVSTLLNKTGLVTQYYGEGELIIAPSLALYGVDVNKGVEKTDLS